MRPTTLFTCLCCLVRHRVPLTNSSSCRLQHTSQAEKKTEEGKSSSNHLHPPPTIFIRTLICLFLSFCSKTQWSSLNSSVPKLPCLLKGFRRSLDNGGESSLRTCSDVWQRSMARNSVLCLFLSTYKMFPQYFTWTFVLVTLSQNVCKKRSRNLFLNPANTIIKIEK